MLKIQSVANASSATIGSIFHNACRTTEEHLQVLGERMRLGCCVIAVAVTLLAAPDVFGQASQIEAEDFIANNGVQNETTTDTGGGQNLCHTNDGDWADYSITIPQAGAYEVDFRVASAGAGGSIEIVSGASPIGSVDVAVTGGWQTYTNVSTIVNFANAGTQTLRLNFNGDAGYLYNINWFSIQAAPLFIEAEDYSTHNGIRTETTTDDGGGLNIGYIANGDWSEYSVAIPAAGDYTIEFRTASNNNDGGAIDIVSDGVTIGNVTVPDTNGWQNWTTVNANVNFATAGTKILRLNYVGGDGSLFNVNWFSISPFTPGDPLTITVGNTRQQQMRYGVDYERLWFWQGSASVRDRFAEWSVADCDVDYVRVAINSKYELTEGVLQEDAYFDNDDNEGGGTNNDRIIPMMQDMKAANPDIKFFASPRPLDEAVNNVAWQPYPQWITGSTGSSSNFSFDEVKCSEYLLRYLILMKQYGFKISYMDLTNEWNFINGTDFRDISALFDEYVDAPANAKPVVHPDYPTVTLTADDIPQLVGASAWSYSQGRSWLSGLTSRLRREALDIVSSHNTDKGGTAQDVVDRVEEVYANDGNIPEVWNTEVHGWKSTSNADEVLTYAYMMECINAGFSGLSGWLAIGFSNQGHCYIVNNQRSVKYYMFEKLSNTSNRGYALDVNEPDELKVYWDPDPDQADADSAVSALIRGNLMTVWVLNHSDKDYPVTINPTGRTISDHPIKITRWSQVDGVSVEGEVQTIESATSTSVEAIAQDNSAYCFEILLEPETGSYVRFEAEGYDSSSPASHSTQATTDLGAGLNLSNINDGNWTSYDDIDLSMATDIRFRIATPSGRPDGEIEIRTGSQTGPVIGRTAIPATNDWQEWLTIETPLEATTGTHDLYLVYTEAGSNQNGTGAMYNLNWFELVSEAPPSEAPTNLTEVPFNGTTVRLSWDAVPDAIGYTVKRSTTQGGPYSVINDTVSGTIYFNTALNGGIPYYYVVVTRYSGGFESAESAEIVAVPSNAISPESIIFGQTGISNGGNAYLFSIMNSEAGHLYQVQGSSTLELGDWTNVGAEKSGNGGILDFVMPISGTDTKSFYRVVIRQQ